MYFKKLKIYSTKLIGELFEPHILQSFIFSILEQKEKGIKVDYLQVFELTPDTENNKLFVKHRQEKTDDTIEFEKILILKTKNFEFVEYGTKLYIVDDIEHQTILSKRPEKTSSSIRKRMNQDNLFSSFNRIYGLIVSIVFF